jgi:acetoacetate decarboxylase
VRFAPIPGIKYEMPVVFGPSLAPAETVYGEVEIISLSYRTTREAVEPFVPAGLGIADSPVLTFSRMTYQDVDFLGGRSYAELTVGISATYETGGEVIKGSYQPVVWIDDGAAMIAGREFLGYAKLLGRIPPVERDNDHRSFEVFEYDARLLRGSVTSMRPLDESSLERVRQASRQTTVFGWKYIASPGGGCDADYLTKIVLSFDVQEGWEGDPAFSWGAPDAVAAPFSSRVVAALSSVPLEEFRPAFIGRGPGRLFRDASLRLT